LKGKAKIRIVSARVEHQCEFCSAQIAKGTRCLNNSGFSEGMGYFNIYFHLTKEQPCYLEFMEVCQIRPESDLGSLILTGVTPPVQIDEAKKLLGIIS